MYGATETIRQANAAQARKSPFPSDTTIPKGTGGEVGTTRWFILWAFFTMTVQITAPMSRKRLPRMAKNVESKNPKACLTKPLYVPLDCVRRISVVTRT